jgi:acetyl-CoA synthetase
VEGVLLRHPAVDDAAAVGLPHPTRGEAIWCFVTGAGLASTAEWQEVLADEIAVRLGKPFRPEAVVALRDLPRTRSNKIARRIIRRVALGEETGDLSGIANPGAIDSLRETLMGLVTAEGSSL